MDWSSFGYSFVFGLSGAMMPGPLLAVTITETLKRGFWAVVWIVCGHSVLELGAVVLLMQTGELAAKEIVAGLVGVIGGAVLLWMTFGMLKQAQATGHVWKAVACMAIFFHILMLSISMDTHGLLITHNFWALIGSIGIFACGAWLWFAFQFASKQEEAEQDEYALANSNTRMQKLGPFGLGIVISLANPYWTFWWLTIGAKLVLDALTRDTAAVGTVYVGHIASDFAWYGLVGAAVVLGRSILSSHLYRWMLAVCAAILLRCGPYFIYTGIRFLT